MISKRANPSVICLMGLTATGKTALAMKLYESIDVNIISVDSAMIYKRMDIGTAKPSNKLLEKYPHKLIDIIEPTESYSAAQFINDTTKLIEQTHQEGKRALLVGGTMLYFRALQQGLNQLPSSTIESKEKLNQELKDRGLPLLYERLTRIDPITAARINANDPQRIMRALEVFYLSGKTMSDLLNDESSKSKFKFLNIALVPEDRIKLHKLIEQRFYQMLEQGFEQEVINLAQEQISLDAPAMRCVGYKQMLEYLAGDINFKQMKEQAIAATRQLAKRQHTWLRKWPDLNSYDPWQDELFTKVKKLI